MERFNIIRIFSIKEYSLLFLICEIKFINGVFKYLFLYYYNLEINMLKMELNDMTRVVWFEIPADMILEGLLNFMKMFLDGKLTDGTVLLTIGW